MEFTTEGTIPPIKHMCAKGSGAGPAELTINYETTMTMPYTFKVTTYNYLTCAMSATALNTLIITLVCVVVFAVVVSYFGVLIYKKVRYNKLIREAAKKEITEDDKKLL